MLPLDIRLGRRAREGRRCGSNQYSSGRSWLPTRAHCYDESRGTTMKSQSRKGHREKGRPARGMLANAG